MVQLETGLAQERQEDGEDSSGDEDLAELLIMALASPDKGAKELSSSIQKKLGERLFLAEESDDGVMKEHADPSTVPTSTGVASGDKLLEVTRASSSSYSSAPPSGSAGTPGVSNIKSKSSTLPRNLPLSSRLFCRRMPSTHSGGLSSRAWSWRTTNVSFHYGRSSCRQEQSGRAAAGRRHFVASLPSCSLSGPWRVEFPSRLRALRKDFDS